MKIYYIYSDLMFLAGVLAPSRDEALEVFRQNWLLIYSEPLLQIVEIPGDKILLDTLTHRYPNKIFQNVFFEHDTDLID